MGTAWAARGNEASLLVKEPGCSIWAAPRAGSISYSVGRKEGRRPTGSLHPMTGIGGNRGRVGQAVHKSEQSRWIADAELPEQLSIPVVQTTALAALLGSSGCTRHGCWAIGMDTAGQRRRGGGGYEARAGDTQVTRIQGHCSLAGFSLPSPSLRGRDLSSQRPHAF